MKSIAIIGGGFSGTITAVNLARLSSTPLEIHVIDKNPSACRGIAYSTRNSSHLLNVAARNMSALADQPNHFVEWLGTRAEYLDEPTATLRERFIPRRTYGEYLASLYQWYSAVLSTEKEMRFEIVRESASNVVTENHHANVVLSSGRTIHADKIVLAVGNLTPVPFRLKGLESGSAKYIGDPWLGWEKKLPPKDQDLLIIGTGLTMVDAILSLNDIGWKGKIYAVSRNGLLPLSHFKGFDYPDYMNDELAKKSFRELRAVFKKHFRNAKTNKINPAILVDKLRPYTQRIWQNFSLEEKKRFNRHLRTKWNVMRHRIAPEIHQQLQETMAKGKLEVIKARLRECQETTDKFRIGMDCNGKRREIEVGAIINCTGPRENYVPSDSILLNNMQAGGLLVPDEMNMGVKVAPNFATIDRSGKTSDMIFATGSIMKGTLWETLAVPELRSQAFRLAEAISSHLGDDQSQKSPIAEVVEDVMEYSI